MIPILIRTKDRPNYLHTTLKSLTGTNLYDGLIVIADDCSNTRKMNDYLFTDKLVKFNKFSWQNQIQKQINSKGSVIPNDTSTLNNQEIWDTYIGNVPQEQSGIGLKNKFNIIQPNANKGDRAGLMWTILAGFSLFRNADRIVVMEDDLIFHKDWLKIANLIYQKQKMSNLGCVSVYNRQISTVNQFLYVERPQIGGVMYMIPRKIFNVMKNEGLFTIDFSKDNLGGDTFFLNWLANKKLKVFNSEVSYIQHIGIKSLCRPGRFLRYSRNFVKPFAWNKDFDNE